MKISTLTALDVYAIPENVEIELQTLSFAGDDKQVVIYVHVDGVTIFRCLAYDEKLKITDSRRSINLKQVADLIHLTA